MKYQHNSSVSSQFKHHLNTLLQKQLFLFPSSFCHQNKKAGKQTMKTKQILSAIKLLKDLEHLKDIAIATLQRTNRRYQERNTIEFSQKQIHISFFTVFRIALMSLFLKLYLREMDKNDCIIFILVFELQSDWCAHQ